MNLEQRIEFARKERRKAAAYEPEQVPGKGRFGKAKRGEDFLPEKQDYCDSLKEFIDSCRGGVVPSPSWQLRKLGYIVDAGPSFQFPEPEQVTVREATRKLGHPAVFGAFHTY